MRVETSFTTAFSTALRGDPCRVVGLDDRPQPIPMHRWSGVADAEDQQFLSHCHGPTLDIGCGPGRMAEALAARGQVVLGIDIVAEAVHQTNRRGALALRRDVFGRLPAEGRWCTALLADGNIGIGGDPGSLLRRVADLLSRDGRAVVELAGPGVPARQLWALLECEGSRSRPFRWAVVGVDDITAVARSAGFLVTTAERFAGRWCVVLAKAPSAAGG